MHHLDYGEELVIKFVMGLAHLGQCRVVRAKGLVVGLVGILGPYARYHSRT